MKYFCLLAVFFLFSCEKKEAILLPKSNVSFVKKIQDLSPIYIFFKVNGKDTIAEVNRKNSIISTNWVFNIDKRLPLRLIMPEIIKLQEKKRAEKAHKNEKAQNYYSYADSIGKNLAFLLFTKVYYKIEKPKSGVIVYFKKNNSVLVNETPVPKVELQNYLNQLESDKSNKIIFSFDKNLNYDAYIRNKIFIRTLKISISELNLTREEFIF